VRAVRVRDVAARGLSADFTLETMGSPSGTIEVRRGKLPWFLFASSETIPLASGVTVHRGLFDASFELAVTPSEAVRITLG
jgi:hypothetical protein